MFRRLTCLALALSAAWSCRLGYDPIAEPELGAAGVAGSAGGSAGSAGSSGAAPTTAGTNSSAGTSSAGQAGAAPGPPPVFEVSYPDFSDPVGLHLVEQAVPMAGVIHLGDAEKNTKAAVYLEQALTWGTASRLSVEFVLRIVSVPGQTPADGMTFVLHDDLRGLEAIGERGGALGYADSNGVQPSLAVEFDIFGAGPEDPPDSEHLAVLANGKLTPLALQATLPVLLASGERVYTWIDYSQPAQSLEVYLSANADKPAQPLLSHTVSLLDTVGSHVFLGFTAASGEGMAQHVLEGLTVRQYDAAP